MPAGTTAAAVAPPAVHYLAAAARGTTELPAVDPESLLVFLPDLGPNGLRAAAGLVAVMRDGSPDLAVLSLPDARSQRPIRLRVLRAAVHACCPQTIGIRRPDSQVFAVRAGLLAGFGSDVETSTALVGVLVHTSWESVREVSGDGSEFEVPPQPWPVVRDLVHRIRTPPEHPGVVAPPDRHSSARVVEDGVPGSALPARPPPPARERVVYGRVLAAILLGFLTVQVVLAATLRNGPFLDEGTYITAGLRTLQGHGIADGYLTWFAGSLFWPTLAAAAFKVGGLIAARVLAALFVTTALTFGSLATRNMFGERAACWAAAGACSSATVLALGHLAVYDVTAVAGLGAMLWALSRADRSHHQRWSAIAALFFAVAVLGKYPTFFMVPVVIGLLVVIYGHRAVAAVGLFALVLVPSLLAFFLPWRFQLVYFLHWRTINNPSFGDTRSMIVYEQLLYGLPFIAVGALGVAFAVPRGRRGLGLVLLSALLVFPVYHVLAGSRVSESKHIAFGIVLSMPLVGVTLDRFAGAAIWRRTLVALLTIAFLGLGLTQVHRLDHGWVDSDSGAAYLRSHMSPIDTLLIPNAWQVLPVLYGHPVPDPKMVTDSYGFTHASPAFDICTVDWLVDTPNDNAWPAAVMSTMRSCGTFTRVFVSHNTLVNLTPHLDFARYEGYFIVYRNSRATP